MLKRAGFTLIELVIVIGVLSILAVVLIAVLNPLGQLQKGRDSQRRTILKQLQGSLEQYYNDNGKYPDTGDLYYSSELGNAAGIDSSHANDNTWIPGLVPKYLTSLPKDPSGGSSTANNCSGYKRAFLYRSTAGGTEYALWAHCSIEIMSTSDAKDPLTDPNRQLSTSQTVWKICQGATACSW